MSITNDFVPFATGGGANVEGQSAYLADSNRTQGNQPGIASSSLNNKALRQANGIASQIAQYVANKTQTDVLDNGVSAQLLAQMFAAFDFKQPVITTFLSGSGTFNPSYKFQIAQPSVNPTSGATYTNNAITFTCTTTVTGLEFIASGPGAPTTSGTLTKTGGTGDATLTFYAVRAPISMIVELVGCGGGGAGGGGAGVGAGGSGGDTTFGTANILTGHGGVGGSSATGGPGAGGTAAITTSTTVLQLLAVNGGNGSSTSASTTVGAGGSGGVGPYGGGGGGGQNGTGGAAGTTNSGSGGSGGGGSGSAVAGSGGGAGGFAKAMFLGTAIQSSFPWAIGNGGTAGAAGSGGGAGGTGALGYILIIQNYQ